MDMYEKICFNSYYDPIEERFYQRSEQYPGNKDSRYEIRGCYMIKLVQDETTQEFSAYEQERIEAYAKENNINVFELHVNPFRDLCVAPKNSRLYIENSKNKQLFIERLLIPFLYSHSFFEKHEKRPWPDYSHNHVGSFEAYQRETEPATKEHVVKNLFYLKDIGFPIKSLIRENPSFLNLLREESEEAWQGANKIMKDIRTFQLERYIK